MLEKNKKSIGVLGCGWLGLPLAQQSAQKGFEVRGSRASATGVKALENEGIDAFQIVLDAETPHYDAQFFEGLTHLIIAVPPGVRKDPERRYDLAIAHLMRYIAAFKIPHILFCSSISVYGALENAVNESTTCHPTTLSGKQILAAEEHILAAVPQATIFRLGGLIGADRHPIYSLAQGLEIPRPNAPINFVHQDEVVAYCMAWLQQPSVGERYNVVSPYHPNRGVYYAACAKQLGIKLPPLGAPSPYEGIVMANKIQAIFGNHFIVNKLLIQT